MQEDETTPLQHILAIIDEIPVHTGPGYSTKYSESVVHLCVALDYVSLGDGAIQVEQLLADRIDRPDGVVLSSSILSSDKLAKSVIDRLHVTVPGEDIYSPKTIQIHGNNYFVMSSAQANGAKSSCPKYWKFGKMYVDKKYVRQFAGLTPVVTEADRTDEHIEAQLWLTGHSSDINLLLKDDAGALFVASLSVKSGDAVSIRHSMDAKFNQEVRDLLGTGHQKLKVAINNLVIDIHEAGAPGGSLMNLVMARNRLGAFILKACGLVPPAQSPTFPADGDKVYRYMPLGCNLYVHLHQDMQDGGGYRQILHAWSLESSEVLCQHIVIISGDKRTDQSKHIRLNCSRNGIGVSFEVKIQFSKGELDYIKLARAGDEVDFLRDLCGGEIVD